MRSSVLVLVGVLLLGAEVAAQTEELRNDGFETGQPVSFQAGFVEGEIGAVRLVPTLSCPCRVESLSLLFGGAGDMLPVLLRIWDDAAGNVEPGTPLYVDSFQLTGTNNALQVIDPSPTDVIVNGPFRVGIEFTHSGLPAIASDGDGNIDTNANFILAEFAPFGFFWFRSADLGVTGDWVIRATISQVAVAPQVPLLPVWGTGALVALMLASGALALRRRRIAPAPGV